MGGKLSVGNSASHLAGGPHFDLSLDYVWELATTRGGLVVVLGLAVILVVRYSRSPWRRVPPGPRGLPLIGNALGLLDKTWLFGRECKEKYGDVMYLTALGQPILVLNSIKAAAELLDRRASIYSDRPRMIMAQEVLSGGLTFPFLGYDDRWRRSRRATHQCLSKTAVLSYHNMLREEAALLTSASLADPCYPTLENEEDETVKEIYAFIERISMAAAPGAYLVDLFPWMLHIPERFARWKYEGIRDFARYNTLFESLHKRVFEGLERPSISASLFKGSSRNQLSGQEMAWLSGDIIVAAGAETTSTTMKWWGLAMIANPEVQRRAHNELDAVPMAKEALRWRPALPLSLPHSTTEDDWYNGMFIPKGTLCLANLWQCHWDPAAYGDDAAQFRPERFLDADGKIMSGPQAAETHDDGHGTYGFGKRACVGKHLANDSLFIYMATKTGPIRMQDNASVS
ncbi:cytochrome P450 [Lactarius deliciosus]|nr:cytochrome P450 [Lactarius deliciosus]